MSPEAEQLTVQQMRKIAKRMREIVGQHDFHWSARHKAIRAAEHAEAVAAEYEEQRH